jgi:hypothetical protein
MRLFRPMAGASRKRERRLDEEDERRAAEESKGSTRAELVLDALEQHRHEVAEPKAARARRHLRSW